MMKLKRNGSDSRVRQVPVDAVRARALKAIDILGNFSEAWRKEFQSLQMGTL
jgi:hypothetical protein